MSAGSVFERIKEFFQHPDQAMFLTEIEERIQKVEAEVEAGITAKVEVDVEALKQAFLAQVVHPLEERLTALEAKMGMAANIPLSKQSPTTTAPLPGSAGDPVSGAVAGGAGAPVGASAGAAAAEHVADAGKEHQGDSGGA